jgi:glycogen synthase
LEAALLQVIDLWADQEAWRALQLNAMQTDVSWAEPADQFFQLYMSLLTPKN